MTNESMKKVFQTALTDTAATDIEGIGVIRFDGSKVYKWVSYNDAAVAAVAGQCVVYHGDDSVVADSAADVTSDYSDGASGVIAGVLQAAITDQEFGWIQIKGVAILSIALDSGTDGDELIVGTTDGSLAVRAAVTEMTAGVALDATAKIVLLDCPWQEAREGGCNSPSTLKVKYEYINFS